ncbi:hypothetical protein GCM10011578_082490 [Streptomyces fuscichromogenes]|uniref:Uncharacterized protein n=1 Tax=Streptomyces fuscichromogenes TaxID=1324013 RepID=A0A918CW31_9ACTN|nr:hypothetical protein GCM10011578_082490 [Streptomyces fuscichromogenes]
MNCPWACADGAVMLPCAARPETGDILAGPLPEAVREAGRRPWAVTLDIVPPYPHVPQRALLDEGRQGAARRRPGTWRWSRDSCPPGGCLSSLPSATLTLPWCR